MYDELMSGLGGCEDNRHYSRMLFFFSQFTCPAKIALEVAMPSIMPALLQVVPPITICTGLNLAQHPLAN